jgi:hypothetical protein
MRYCHPIKSWASSRGDQEMVGNGVAETQRQRLSMMIFRKTGSVSMDNSHVFSVFSDSAQILAAPDP